ncbi:Uncharacterised protein [Serratia rubidaea]|uniref:Uncharacterized protein n=1 Tax=Serratia rubidaea TaxID=61652 RepID=A0A4U9HSZ9_SERRU|nr:hypothetical protein [Serratia rubidaea]MBD8453860.1 hypothetical protein [Serratia rubidaea]QPR64508.1 hypothetical protein I6G83_04395 [Serratia rubidaea]CAI1033967.1 Uncharacterised protein [Serratia rubidaea]CAI1867378.1 Uncharacterised protein [Serratia rubidaea]VTP67638.1 Uncharacterised protein [Serratia rubidaea]
MSFYLMLIGSVLVFSGIGFFIFIMLYFGVTKKKYETIVSGYLSRALPMPDVYTVFYHGGFFTSFLLVRFMRQVLLGKKIGPGKKGYRLPAESYDYFNTLPNELIVWIKKYYMLHIIELSIIISGSLFILLDSLLRAVVPGYAAYSG